MKLQDLFEVKMDPEIVDAAKAVGTVAELTPEVYQEVQDLLRPLKLMDDGELASKIRSAKGSAKFAIRVALKAIDRREPEDK